MLRFLDMVNIGPCFSNCVATPWCVVLIFRGHRTKENSVQFYSLSKYQ